MPVTATASPAVGNVQVVRHDDGQTGGWRQRPSARRVWTTTPWSFPLDLDEAPAPRPVLAGILTARTHYLGRVRHGEACSHRRSGSGPRWPPSWDGSRSYDRPLDLYQWSNITTPNRTETLGLRWAITAGSANRARALRSRQSGCREAVCDARLLTPSFSASSKTGRFRATLVALCRAGIKSSDSHRSTGTPTPARRRPRPRRSRRLGALASRRAGGARMRQISPSRVFRESPPAL